MSSLKLFGYFVLSASVYAAAIEPVAAQRGGTNYYYNPPPAIRLNPRGDYLMRGGENVYELYQQRQQPRQWQEQQRQQWIIQQEQQRRWVQQQENLRYMQQQQRYVQPYPNSTPMFYPAVPRAYQQQQQQRWQQQNNARQQQLRNWGY